MGLAALWLLIAAVGSLLSATSPQQPRQMRQAQSSAGNPDKTLPARPTLLAVQLHFCP
jgi:hypothetical protein